MIRQFLRLLFSAAHRRHDGVVQARVDDSVARSRSSIATLGDDIDDVLRPMRPIHPSHYLRVRRRRT